MSQSPTLVVHKFGGTSVATPSRWAVIADVIRTRLAEGVHPVVVCSAVAGVSDGLEALLHGHDDASATHARLEDLRHIHAELAQGLGLPVDLVDDEIASLKHALDAARALGELTPRTRARIMATGALMSTRIRAAWLRRAGLDVRWTDARDLLCAEATEDAPDGRRYLSATCDFARAADLRTTLLDRGAATLTQGFIARDPNGDTVLLGRGGSDTSAAYLAARLGADRLEIWTDVDGLYSANPRAVDAAHRLSLVSYDEATNMAALGAKVLHPRCLGPVRNAGIPLVVKSTKDPAAPGTTVTADHGEDGIRAVTSRKGLTLITMRRDPTWQPVGFLADVTERFRDHGFSIDLVSTSAGIIQATIDMAAAPLAEGALDRLMESLQEVSEASMLRNVASVSLVGRNLRGSLAHFGSAMEALEAARVGMVTTGANDAHVTFVVRESDVDDLVRLLHAALFEDNVLPMTRTSGPSSHALGAK